MKRMLAILTTIMMFMTTTVFANVNIPEALMKYPENFTAATSISISIDDNSDVRNLIEEILNTDDTMGIIYGTEFLTFLSALFDYDGTVNVQADISPDYKKIKLAVTNSTELSSIVSSNLNYTVKANCGLWADIDLTNKESPKCDVIFLMPTSEKYRYINVGKYITQEVIESYNEVFDWEEVKKMTDEFLRLLYDNSTLEETETGYKLSMDNAGLVNYMSKVIQYSYDDGMYSDEEVDMMFNNIQFLGKEGITAVYTIKNGEISYGEASADICLNISNIAKTMGQEWPYEASGIINIKISEKVDLTQIGTTEVKYPALNSSNSISLNKMIEEQLSPDNSYEYVIEYPFNHIRTSSNALPVVNNDYYVPLRSVLENGYQESVSIDYQDGVITASSEFFEGFKTLKMTIGDDKIYIDDTEYTLGTVICNDGVTYVSTRLFTEVFGWELSDITHEILENRYSVSFWTSY